MSEPKYSISERIRQAMDMTGLRQVDLVERTGIPKGSINQYVSGYVEPKSERIHKIAKAFGVQETWLMGYDVPLDKSELVLTAEIMADLSHDERFVHRMMCYYKLSVEDKKTLDAMIDAFLQSKTGK